MKHLNISTFGDLVGIDRKTLIFYDQEGILHPAVRGANGYRYYSVSQVNELCILLLLQELGLSLKEIKKFQKERSRGSINCIFNQQIPVLRSRIQKLENTLDMVSQRRSQMEELKHVELNTIGILEMDEQYYYRSPLCHINKASGYDETWERFYISCLAMNISQGYPICYMIKKEELQEGRVQDAQYLAFHVKSKEISNFTQAPGIYAVTYVNATSATDESYRMILHKLEEWHYQIIGGAVEEVVSDEAYSADPRVFVTKVSIPISPMQETV